jgi:hypothetical protein
VYDGDGRLFDLWMPKPKPRPRPARGATTRRGPIATSVILDDAMKDLALDGETFLVVPREPTEFDDDLLEMREAESA